MARSLRVVVADDEPGLLTTYARMLKALGHEVVGTASSGNELIDQCAAQRPNLVITDIKMGEIDGIEAARLICQNEAVPILFVTGFSEPDLVARAQGEYVLGYLIKPVRKADLEAAIAIAMGRFEEFQILRMEADHYRQTLAHRKLIERAKGILMRKAHLGEADAFARLQHLATDKQRKIVDIAEMIITADDVLK